MLTPLELWKNLCLSKQRNKACRTKVSIESHISCQLYFIENSHLKFLPVKYCFQIDLTFLHCHLMLIWCLVYLYLERMFTKNECVSSIILHCLCRNPTATKTLGNSKLWSERGIAGNTLFEISGQIMLLRRFLGTLKKNCYQNQFHNYVTNQNKIMK